MGKIHKLSMSMLVASLRHRLLKIQIMNRRFGAISVLIILTLLHTNVCFGDVSVTFHNNWIEYDVIKDGKRGMVIHSDFTINGMKDKVIDVTVWFRDKDGISLKGNEKYGKYSNDGNVCTYYKQAPSYDSSHFSDWDSFIPYSELGLKQGEENYYCYLIVYDDNLNPIATSNRLYFKSSKHNSSTSYNYNHSRCCHYIDNSEKIEITKSAISRLESEKSNCYVCHGSGYTKGTPCIACSGQGIVRTGYNPPLYVNCSFCHGLGRNPQKCTSCMQKDITIGGMKAVLHFLEKSNGMSQEQYEKYCLSENYRTDINKADRDFMRSLNSMSSSSTASTSSTSSCNICHGTGMDPFAWETGNIPSGGGYTNSKGSDCPYCHRYTWHQHKYCPKCNAHIY